MNRCRAGSKINWTLRVLGRREDGFHELRSWFVALADGDELAWSTEDEGGLVVDGPFQEGVPTDDRNLVLRAEQVWRQAGGRARPIAWRLTKHLPVGSGLGAGSADAAAALRVLQTIAVQPLAASALAELAIELGSDVPFFLMQEDAILLGGRGEFCLATASAPCSHIALVLPPWSASTPRVFAALAAPPLTPERETEDPALHCLPGGNDLQGAALMVVPQLQTVAAQLAELGEFQLSGSGSAWFAPCETASHAEHLVDQVLALGLPARAVQVGRPEPCPTESSR